MNRIRTEICKISIKLWTSVFINLVCIIIPFRILYSKISFHRQHIGYNFYFLFIVLFSLILFKWGKKEKNEKLFPKILVISNFVDLFNHSCEIDSTNLFKFFCEVARIHLPPTLRREDTCTLMLITFTRKDNNFFFLNIRS